MENTNQTQTQTQNINSNPENLDAKRPDYIPTEAWELLTDDQKRQLIAHTKNNKKTKAPKTKKVQIKKLSYDKAMFIALFLSTSIPEALNKAYGLKVKNMEMRGEEGAPNIRGFLGALDKHFSNSRLTTPRLDIAGRIPHCGVTLWDSRESADPGIDYYPEHNWHLAGYVPERPYINRAIEELLEG